jgi:hypothetical protein
MMIRRSTIVLVLFLAGSPALPCTLCPGLPNVVPLRQELHQSKMALYGALANPKLTAGGTSGTVELHIEGVLKSDPFLAGKKVLVLPRYVPVDPKNPPRFLVFCEIVNNQVDPYRPLPVKSPAIVDYLRGAAALDSRDRSAALLYFFRFLDHADPDIAADAYLEFARASDAEVGQVARKLDPDRLRRLINDAQTPANRLGLYAFLLGACGSDRDADFLRSVIERPSERTTTALDGILAGYVQLRPREGWELAGKILGDARRPFPEREAILRMYRFVRGWKAEDHRREIVDGIRGAVPQGDIADLAVEDLRKAQWWDLTGDILSQYGKDSHKAPIVRRAIIRYALSCPLDDARDFIARVRKEDPTTVRDVEESLQFEKRK